MEKKNYVEPAIEIIEVQIEKGYAASFPGADGEDGPVHWWQLIKEKFDYEKDFIIVRSRIVLCWLSGEYVGDDILFKIQCTADYLGG